MAKDPIAGLLIGAPGPVSPDEAEESEAESSDSDEGELAAAEAAISAINDGDAKAFLDAIKLLRG